MVMFLLALLWFVVGLFVGSFLNVVVERLHAGKDFVRGRSQCPHCHKQLGPLELIPLVSWLVQRGCCRHCREPISVQYPIAELVTGALFAASYLALQPASVVGLVLMLIWLYVLGSLIVLAIYDLKWYLLPDKVLLPIIAPALLIATYHAYATGSWQVLLGPLAATILFGGWFYGLAAISQGRWMGGGDIKLAFVMGLLLGLQKTFLAMLIAFNGAAIIGVALIVAGRKKRTDQIPFGPFLIGGTIVAYLWGTDIINWYLNISGLHLLVT